MKKSFLNKGLKKKKLLSSRKGLRLKEAVNHKWVLIYSIIVIIIIFNFRYLYLILNFNSIYFTISNDCFSWFLQILKHTFLALQILKFHKTKWRCDFMGKFSQDHEFSEKFFFKHPRNPKKIAKNSIFFNFLTSNCKINAYFVILSKLPTKLVV